MNAAAIAELKQKRTALIDEMSVLNDKAAREQRTFSRTEQKKWERLKRESDELTETIPEEADKRARALGYASDEDMGEFNPFLAGVPAAEPTGAVLKPEQRMQDWVRDQRGFGFLGSDNAEDFSLGRVVRARVTGDHRGLTDLERRAMAEGTDAAGGVLVPEELSSLIIDRARAASVIFQAGAVVAPMESDTLVLARLATGNTAAWKAENAAISTSDQVWERVQLSAHTVVVEQIMSRELFEDLSPAGEEAIRNEIAQAIALKLDLAALEGSGTSPEPRGIVNTTNVNSVSMGTNGLKPTSYDQVVNAVFASLKQNSAAPTAGVFHPRDLEILALLKDTTNQPLRKPDAIADLPLLSTSQIATTVTQGTSTDTSRGYVGDFSQLIVGLRPSLQVRFQVLQERFSDNLQVAFLAWLRGDIALGHPEHFTKIIGLRIV